LKQLSFFFICSFLLLTACSEKYEEGPDISFLRAKTRVEGEWKWAIARKVERGIQTNQSLLVAEDTLHLRSDGVALDSRYGLEGEWSLISKNTELNLIFGQEADSLQIPPAIAFRIKRLLEREMWLEFADDSITIEWQLRSVSPRD
jgi:hypothetical protein